MSSFSGEWGSTPSSEPEDNLPGSSSYYFPQRASHTPSPTHSRFGSLPFDPPSKLDSSKPLPNNSYPTTSLQPNHGSSHRVQSVHSRHSSYGPTSDSVQVQMRLRDIQKTLSQKDLQYKELLTSFNTLTSQVGAAIDALRSHGQMGSIGDLPTYDREEYPDIQFWTSTSYSIETKAMAQAKKQKSGVTGVGDRQQQQRKKRVQKSNDDPAADMWFFLQLADGQVVTEGIMEQIRKLVRALLFDIKSRGLAAESWERVGFTAKSYVYFHLIRAFPFVALCDFNYKAEIICHEVYPAWRRNYEKGETSISVSVKEDITMLSPEEESKPSGSALSGLSTNPPKRPGTPTSTNPEPSKRAKLMSATNESPSVPIDLTSPPRSPQTINTGSHPPTLSKVQSDMPAKPFSDIVFSNPLLNMFDSVQSFTEVNSLSTTTTAINPPDEPTAAAVSANKQTTPTVDVPAPFASDTVPFPAASKSIPAPATNDNIPAPPVSNNIPAPSASKPTPSVSDNLLTPFASENIPPSSASDNKPAPPVNELASSVGDNIHTPPDSANDNIRTPFADDNLFAPSTSDAIPPPAMSANVPTPLVGVDSVVTSVASDMEHAINTTSHPDTPSLRDIYPSIPKIGLAAPVAGTGVTSPPTAPMPTTSTIQSPNAITPTTQPTTNGRPSRKAALVKNPKTERSWRKNYFVATFGGSEDDFKTWLEKSPSEPEEEAYRTWRHAQPGLEAL